MLKTSFEKESCGRCGGSGHYSYCQSYGTKCFSCHGTGERLTKRGKAALDYLVSLRSKRADAVVPGDVFLAEGFSCGSFSQPSKWHTVLTVEQNHLLGYSGPERTPHYGLNIVAEGTAHAADPATMFRIRQTAEQSADTLAQALAYQATLSKAGKPMKRAALAARVNADGTSSPSPSVAAKGVRS